MLRNLIALLLITLNANAGEFANRYSTFLSGLDGKRPDSVCSARDTLHSWLPKATHADRAVMLRAFLKFNREVAGESIDAFTTAVAPVYDRASAVLKTGNWTTGSAAAYLRSDPLVRQAIASWLDCGFGIYMSEGIFYPGADVATIDSVAPALPLDLRAWISFLKREGGFDDPVQDDDALRLSWQQLGDRLHRWEDFLRAHPDLDAEIRPEILRLASFFFFGLNNTPIRDFHSNVIDSDVLAAWRRFAAGRSSSRYAATARKLLALLDSNGHNLTPEVDALRNWIAAERQDYVQTTPPAP